MNVRRSLAAVAFLLAVPALSSCGGNFNAQTDQVYNPAAGVDDRSGAVDVLNALIVSGSDGSGTVIATLVSNDDRPGSDTLRGVAGSGSDSSLKVTPGGDTQIPSGGLLNLAAKGKIFVAGARVVPGNFVTITFSFAKAKSVQVQVPVVRTSSVYSGVTLPTAP
ncbi:MAG: hypothetical protein ABI776_17950 [Nocardioidaceae bacterium]